MIYVAEAGKKISQYSFVMRLVRYLILKGWVEKDGQSKAVDIVKLCQIDRQWLYLLWVPSIINRIIDNYHLSIDKLF